MNKHIHPTSEVMGLYHVCRLIAISQLIEEYAHKNRALMVQRLLKLKHLEEQKIAQNNDLEAQYGRQNSVTNGLSLGGFK